jgi:hypothetical protein
MSSERPPSLLPIVFAVVLVVAGVAKLAPRPPATVGAPPVATAAVAPPSRLVRAGNDLFWTAGDSVYRAAIDAAPGGRRLVHRAQGAAYGALAVAGPRRVFVADRDRIVRLPLLPVGPAVTVAVTRRPVTDLYTDGTSLFWADDQGIRTVWTAGGTIRTIAAEHAIQDIDLRGGRVVFATGRAVKSVSTAGGPVATEVVARNIVTSICAAAELSWIELGVEVHHRAGAYFRATPGRVVDGLSCADDRVLWSECLADRCVVHARIGHRALAFHRGDAPHDFVGDATATTFVTSDGIRRHKFCRWRK